MPNIFNSVPVRKVPRSHFDLSHDHKTTFDMGQLVPVYWEDVLPGDAFNISCETLLRFAPLVAPVMHRFNLYVHYFFVPRRILWGRFDKWIVQQQVDSGYTHPYFMYNAGESADGISGYLGLPDLSVTTGTPQWPLDIMPFGAYQLIYNEYYRDQNLVTDLFPDRDISGGILVDGDNSTNWGSVFNVMRRRAWTHDYFTSCLPFAQKGAAVSLPIDIKDLKVFANDSSSLYTTLTGAPNSIAVPGTPSSNVDVGAGGLFAQGGVVTESTIADLRRSYALQRWLEMSARAGTRYTENLRSEWNVIPDDARLQRPEYITGLRTPVVVSEVLNTAGSFDPADPTLPSSPPQGNMSGHGVAVAAGSYGKYFAKEHGIIMGIMSVMPEPAYQQGISRHWFKADPVENYAHPLFASIGEQAVSTVEIYAADATLSNEIFGYIPRYSEYKYHPSQVSGNFRNSLDFWTMGRIFAACPALNQAFIECDPGKRIFAVTDPDINSLWCHHYNKVSVVRALPKYGVPNP